MLLMQTALADDAALTLRLAASLDSPSFVLDKAEPVYQKALASSRSGMPEAEAQWRSALAQPQLPLRYLFDYVTALTWAGRNDEALAWVEQLSARLDTPVYVLEALARAARNRKLFGLAETLYRQALAKDPARWESQVGLVYAMADGNAHAAALAAGKNLSVRQPKNPESWLAYGYAAGSAQEYTEALHAYQRLTKLVPKEREGWRGYIQSLRMLGAFHQAGELAARHADALSAEESAALQADKAAVLIRWGAADEDKVALRYLHTDMALREEERLLHMPSLNDRLRYDRLVALANRHKSAEVVALYETLLREEKTVPDFGRAAAAASYQELKQPEQAREIYRALLAEAPQNASYRWGLFHAQVDCEDHAAAQETIDRLAEAEPLWIHAYSPLMMRENPAYLETRQSAAMARAYADQLDDAQQRLETLLQRAPGNTATRTALSNVARWRGWPRRAMEESELALSSEPQFKEARLSAQAAALARQDWQRAQTETQWLVTNYPEDRSAQDAAAMNALHDMRELAVDSTWDAGGETGHSFTLHSKLYSAPLSWGQPRSWRAFASLARMNATFEDGNGFRQWLGAGLDYAWRDWSAQVELRDGVRPNRAGLAGNVTFSADDHWTFHAAAETDTTDLPAKGLNLNLTAQKYTVSATWRRDEARQISATATRQEFNDNNRRNELSAVWRERWVNQPRFKLYTDAALSQSDNSLADAPYFNPSSATGAGVDVIAEWLGSRRFERSLWHRVVVGAGTYAQEGFGTLPASSVKYEQDWALDRATFFTWGIGLKRHPYDGQKETARYLDLRLNWRF